MLAIFLDIEATGLDSFRHSPIDIALKIVDIKGGIEKGSYQSVILPTQEIWEKRDLSSMEINGYLWEDLALGKPLVKVKEEILDLLQSLKITRGKAVFICQNPAFDRGFFSQIIDVYTQEKLNWPYHWLDFASMYFALVAQDTRKNKLPFPETLNLSKNAIAKLYDIPPEASPHKAMNGVDHLIACYQAVFGMGRCNDRT